MKKIFTLAIFVLTTLGASAQFSEFFSDKTLRMDYYHAGTAQEEDYFFKELIEEPYWGGSKVTLLDDKEYGNQLLKVFDVASGKLIYSTGFCTLFDEWQTTTEAKTMKKGYPESVVMPFPKAPVRIELWARGAKNIFQKKFEYTTNPSSYFIRKARPNLETWEVVYSGDHAKKVDIVVLGEGYTEGDKEKFRHDADRFASELLKYEPFKSRAKQFNIRAVWSPSAQSGATMPGENIWKNTALKSSYYTFDSERYIMVDDFQNVRDIASNVPYDYIYILANTKKYGGGGIYNFYGISAAGDPSFAGKVYVHEFGHLLIGLGDEYVGTTGYDEFYAKDVEPWEENLTTLVDFKNKMWSKMLPKDAKIPTTSSEERVLGVYEGGGYQAKGIYRPWVNCLMRNLWVIEDFCPVCTKTIEMKIDKLIK